MKKGERNMRNAAQRTWSILTTLALLLGLCSPLGGLVPEAAAEESATYQEEAPISETGESGTEILGTGTAGTDVTWSIDADYVLRISGSGRMEDMSLFTINWSCDGVDYMPLIRRVIIEDGITYIGKYAFSQCPALESISIPDSVTELGVGIFYKCYALSHAPLPQALTEIPKDTFYNCRSLVDFVIPEGVTKIGARAFYDCSSLTELELSDRITTIESDAFHGSGLTHITFPAGLQVIPSGVVAFCYDLESVKIPDSVTTIEGNAFSQCDKLETIFIPDSVTSMPGATFYACKALRSIRLPAYLPEMGTKVFDSCEALEYLRLPEGITELKDHTFLSCDSLKLVEFPSTLKKIGDQVFWGDGSLQEIRLPEGLEEIGYEAFSTCDAMTTVVLPASLKSIGENAFGGTNYDERAYYYAGSEEEWEQISGSDASPFSQSTIYYQSTGPEVEVTEQIPVPVLFSAENETDGVLVSWSLPLAPMDIQFTVDGYQVLRKTEGGDFQLLADAGDSHSYLDPSAEEGVTYTYTVRAYYADQAGDYDPDGLSILRQLPQEPGGGETTSLAPVLWSVENQLEGIELSWNSGMSLPEVPGVEVFYLILRKTGGESDYTQIAQVSGINTQVYLDQDVTEGTEYTYTVKMVFDGVESGCDETGLSIVRTSVLIQDLAISALSETGVNMLPLTGPSYVTLTLESGLPEAYLDGDGVFTGRVRLTGTEDGQLLAEGGDVSYVPELQELYAVFSPGEGAFFPPNTLADIQLLDPQGRVLDSIRCRTYFQKWAADNFSTDDFQPVSRDLLYELLGGDESSGWWYDNKADQLIGKGTEPGKGGFCFGMALSVSLANYWSDAYHLDGFDLLDQGGDDVTVLARQNMAGQFQNRSAAEFIQMCHLMQYLSAFQEEMDGNRWNYEGLLAAIRRYGQRESPMPLIWIEHTDSGESHTLGAYDYEIDGSTLTIWCYNCNVPNIPAPLTITNYTDADAAVWSFNSLGWSGSQSDKGFLGKEQNYLTFCTPDKIGTDLVHYAQTGTTSVLVRTAAQDPWDQVQAAEGIQVVPVSYLSSAQDDLLASSRPFEGSMAWVSGTGTLDLGTIASLGEVTLADDLSVYQVSASSASAVALVENMVQTVSAGGDRVSLACTFYSHSDPVRKTTVRFDGQPVSPEASVTLERSGDTVTLQNTGADSTITVTYEDPTGSDPEESWTQTVPEGDVVSVTADGTQPPVITGEESGEDGGGNEGTPDNSATSIGGGSPSSYPPQIADSQGGRVTISIKAPSRGDQVTITPCPDPDYELAQISVTDRSGNAVALTDNKDGTFSFIQPAGSVTIQALFQPTAHPFTDVSPDSWYGDAVQYVYRNNLMAGTGPTSFHPDMQVSRAMFVTVLWRLSGCPEADGQISFDDVAAGAWYEQAVRWAAGETITQGYGDNSFGPDDPLTREQLAAMLYRYAQSVGLDVSEQAELLPYSDASQISEYALPAMGWACGSGILSGTGSDTLSPQGTATRAQLAVILTQLCNWIGKEP